VLTFLKIRTTSNRRLFVHDSVSKRNSNASKPLALQKLPLRDSHRFQQRIIRPHPVSTFSIIILLDFTGTHLINLYQTSEAEILAVQPDMKDEAMNSCMYLPDPYRRITRIKQYSKIGELTTLLRDTNSFSPSAGSFCMLTTHSQAPIVSQTTMSADFLQPLQIITQL